MNLQELKQKSPTDLLKFAEGLEIENASTLRKQDMLFVILKQMAENDTAIFGTGVLEVLQDGFGFCGPRKLIICLDQTTYMSHLVKCVGSVCEQGIQ